MTEGDPEAVSAVVVAAGATKVEFGVMEGTGKEGVEEVCVEPGATADLLAVGICGGVIFVDEAADPETDDEAEEAETNLEAGTEAEAETEELEVEVEADEAKIELPADAVPADLEFPQYAGELVIECISAGVRVGRASARTCASTSPNLIFSMSSFSSLFQKKNKLNVKLDTQVHANSSLST